MKVPSRFSLNVRNLLLAFALIASAQVVMQQPASAEPPCDYDVVGRTVGLGCLGNGGGGGGDIDPDWEVYRPWVPRVNCLYDPDTGDVPNGPLDGDEIPSYIADLRNVNTGEIEIGACVAFASNTPGLSGIARRMIEAPEIKTDYLREFLTGAPIKFSSSNLQNFTLTVPGFPNASLTVTAIDVTWDFGDGTTSKDLEATHTYESIAPNQSNRDQHEATVNLTGTWRVIMLDSTTGTSTDLGTVTGTGTLTRSLVQVWSKQTEPNS